MSETRDPTEKARKAAAGASPQLLLAGHSQMKKSCFSTAVAATGETLLDAPRIPNKSLWNFASPESAFDLLL